MKPSLAPFLDASTAVLASASASRRAAATAGIPVARSPTCPAAANLASRSRPDVDSCVSCVSFRQPCLPAGCHRERHRRGVGRGRGTRPGARRPGSRTRPAPRRQSRDASGRPPPDACGAASCAPACPRRLLLVLVGSPSPPPAGKHGSSAASCVSASSRPARASPTRGGGGATGATRPLSRASACAPAGGGERAGRGGRPRRGRAVRAAAFRVAPRARSRPRRRDFAARRVVARRRRRRRSVVGTNDHRPPGAGPRAGAAVAVGSTTALAASNESERMPSSTGRPRRVGARGEGGVSNLDGPDRRGNAQGNVRRHFLNWEILVRYCVVVHARDGTRPFHLTAASWLAGTRTVAPRTSRVARHRVRRRASGRRRRKYTAGDDARRCPLRRTPAPAPLTAWTSSSQRTAGPLSRRTAVGDVTAGQSAVSVGRARSTRVERTRSDLPIVGASVGSGRGGGVRRSGATRVRGRTWSASILWLLQISSLSLYIEMPLAHAKPKAKDVIRVPNILVPTLGGVFSSRSPRTRARSRLPSSASSSSSTRGSGA